MMVSPYSKYLENLSTSRQATGDLFGQMLSSTEASKKAVSDRYGLMGENLRRMSETASGQAASGYGGARQRVQNAPQTYALPQAPAPQVGSVPMVGADAATIANLQADASQAMAAEQAAMRRAYDQLAASDAANRASRLSDIDIAQTSDLAQLAALAQAQQFGLGQAETAELSQLDALINQIQRDQITSDLGFSERELNAINAMVAEDRAAEMFGLERDRLEFDIGEAAAAADRAERLFEFEQNQAIVEAAQNAQVFDQNAVNSAVSMFTAMVNPIVDTLEPTSLLELWLAFSEEIGMPMNQALGSVGAV